MRKICGPVISYPPFSINNFVFFILKSKLPPLVKEWNSYEIKIIALNIKILLE